MDVEEDQAARQEAQPIQAHVQMLQRTHCEVWRQAGQQADVRDSARQNIAGWSIAGPYVVLVAGMQVHKLLDARESGLFERWCLHGHLVQAHPPHIRLTPGDAVVARQVVVHIGSGVLLSLDEKEGVEDIEQDLCACRAWGHSWMAAASRRNSPS